MLQLDLYMECNKNGVIQLIGYSEVSNISEYPYRVLFISTGNKSMSFSLRSQPATPPSRIFKTASKTTSDLLMWVEDERVLKYRDYCVIIKGIIVLVVGVYLFISNSTIILILHIGQTPYDHFLLWLSLLDSDDVRVMKQRFSLRLKKEVSGAIKI